MSTKPMEERLADRQARRDGSGESGGETQRVPVNIYESDGALVIVAPLPGVMPDNVEVEVDGSTLTIKAAMRAPAPKEYIVHEWHYGPFERTIDLPDGFGGEPKLSFGNGQVAISVPRQS